MNNNFRLINNMKKFIMSLDSFLDNYPKKELVMKDNMYKCSYEILEHIFYANQLENEPKMAVQKQIVSKLSMLDFYLERSYKLHFISEKQCLNKSNELLVMTKMIYGWIKNG